MALETASLMIWVHALAALGFGLFALHLRLGWHGGAHGARLILVTLLSALWAAAIAASATGVLPDLAMFVALLDGAREAGWLLFLCGLLGLVATDATAKQRLVWLRLGVLAALSANLLVGWTNAVGWMPAQAALGAALAAAVAMLVAVEQCFRNFPEGSRWGIKPLCLGLGGAFAFDLYLYADAFLFGGVDPDIVAVRGLAHVLAMPLVAVSAARSRDWTLRIAVSRRLVFHSTALAASGAYLLLIAAAGYYVRWAGGEWGRALQVVLLFVGLLGLGVLGLSGSVRARARVLLAKHFFSYRYDWREEWLRFTQVLAGASPELPAGQAAILALGKLVESPGGSLWLRQPDGSYTPQAALNCGLPAGREPADGPLAGYLATQQWIVDLAEYRGLHARYEGLTLPGWLAEQPDAWLVLPLFVAELGVDQLAGFVVLDTARAPFAIDWEVRDLLKTAGRQAASYLVQAEATAALLEAQKFDSFNRMSAFVVHDLKNLVAQLSLMLKNADRHRDNPEFQQDMLDTVAHVLERMKGLMAQLQEKRSIDPVRPVDLAELAVRVAHARRAQRPAVTLACESGVKVLAHPERLERIVGHLVQNALDATHEDGMVALAVRREADDAVVEVRDNGCGMSPEFVRQRLFRPFQTTKSAGMGIGAYETQQYVRELGGQLTVDSAPGRGTLIRVRLPAQSLGMGGA